MNGRYETPERLAVIANAPLGVCRLIFAVADYDIEGVRLIRSSKIDDDTLRQRKAVIWAAKFHTSHSLEEIGRALSRDHSSVLRSLEDTKDLWLLDAPFRALCDRIARQSLFRGRPGSAAMERAANGARPFEKNRIEEAARGQRSLFDQEVEVRDAIGGARA